MRLILFIFIISFLSGCFSAPGKGVYHTVGKGETFWRICKTYGVDMQEVAEINNIRDPREIDTGRKIFIPGARKKKKVVPYTPLASAARPAPQREAEKEKEEEQGRIVVEKDRFIWPVKGEIISGYGQRGMERHGGLDIKAAEGHPVKAADSGEAVFVNSGMRGYGNIIILKHKDDFYTVYAHNKENLVKKGDKVERGAVIAKVGSTGNASTCHLHFEVRQGKTVRNPLFFLP